MIQPSVLLHNRNVHAFRAKLFQKCRVDAILDFTSIRNLYEADPKTIAVFAYAGKPAKGHYFNHSTFRRTVSVHQRICFELDHYDRHRVSQEQAENDPYVWRANLLGGGRLVEISQRFHGIRTLEQYVNQQGWDYGEGFIVARKKKKTPTRETRKPAAFLTDRPFLPTKAFTEAGIDETRIRTVTDVLFESPRQEERFTPPLILIKELVELPIEFWDKHYITYGHEIVGIHASSSESDKHKLRELYSLLCKHRDFLRFMVLLHSSRAFIAKSTSILKSDIDQLPLPERPDAIDISFWEEAIQSDVLNYMAEFIRRGQNSQLLKRTATVEDLREYSGMLIRMLGSVYDNLNAADPIFINELICQPFYFGDKPIIFSLDNISQVLQEIVYHKKYDHLRTIRVVRHYDGNVFLIFKPNRLRYWIRSTAIRDADETLIDLRQQGY